MVSRPQMVLVLLRSLIFARPDLGNPRMGSTGSYSTSLIRRVTSRRRKTTKNTCSVRNIAREREMHAKVTLMAPRLWLNDGGRRQSLLSVSDAISAAPKPWEHLCWQMAGVAFERLRQTNIAGMAGEES